MLRRYRPIARPSILLLSLLLLAGLASPLPAEKILQGLRGTASNDGNGALVLGRDDKSRAQADAGAMPADAPVEQAPTPAPRPARAPWYQRAWNGVVEEARLLPGTLRALPQAYWDTARSGKQISSLSGFVDGFTDTMNPFGGGTRYGPLMGQRGAYGQGARVGETTGQVENAVLLASGVHGASRALPGMVRAFPGVVRATPSALRSLPGTLRAAPGRMWGAVRGGGANAATGEAAAVVQQPRRIMSARALLRSAEDAGANHNFPALMDDVIYSQGNRTLVPGYFRQARPGLTSDSIRYTMPGHVNGKAGYYEIFTRPSVSGRNEVIMHRLFRPTRGR